MLQCREVSFAEAMPFNFLDADFWVFTARIPNSPEVATAETMWISEMPFVSPVRLPERISIATGIEHRSTACEAATRGLTGTAGRIRLLPNGGVEF